jgi:PBP1b-binding outer membrane lipoprotein LpoB
MKPMSSVSSVILAVCMLAGCISSSSPPAPEKNTTVVVPKDSGTTVVCQDGTKPPCR